MMMIMILCDHNNRDDSPNKMHVKVLVLTFWNISLKVILVLYIESSILFVKICIGMLLWLNQPIWVHEILLIWIPNVFLDARCQKQWTSKLFSWHLSTNYVRGISAYIHCSLCNSSTQNWRYVANLGLLLRYR